MALHADSASTRLSRPIIRTTDRVAMERGEGIDMTAVDVVIMAAGKGTRMKSRRPKVLHRLGGRALVDHVVASAAGLAPRRIVVITGHGAQQVEDAVRALPVGATATAFVRQEPQLGTGHAVQQAVPQL